VAKIVKGHTARRALQDRVEREQVDAWIESLMPRVRPIAHVLDDVIRELLPEAYFTIARRRVVYGLEEYGWVIELAPYAISANVVFFAGADFKPAPELGSGTERYVKVTSVEAATEPDLLDWIAQAGRTPGWL
jgi:hypothetical protein